jgi:hypothetical protein
LNTKTDPVSAPQWGFTSAGKLCSSTMGVWRCLIEVDRAFNS